MNKLLNSQTISTGLAVFAMFFGAGNLIYPLVVGMTSGNSTGLGFLGFSLTAVLLPLAGLVAMILFEGDYEAFFNRLGKIPGALLIAICMIIIGPLIAIPRIVTLSHTMIAPFMPLKTLQVINPLSSFIFAIIFLGVTFLMTYRENKIVNLLGSIVSPLLLISLAIIIIKGFFSGTTPIASTYTPLQIVIKNVIRGYETLDLLGGIFFASIVFKILKQTTESNVKRLAYLGLKSGLLGVGLLALIYAGMSYLSAFNGLGLESLDAGELFREISFRVLGNGGTAIIGTAVLMACLSTSIALGAVVGEYVQHTIARDRISFVTALLLVLAASIPLSIYGLRSVLMLTGGVITYVGYPILIALTIANIVYKLFAIRAVKAPVLVVFVIALISYLW
ncbi:branched-chain amino acid transport system II carrier protein [Candidatus Dependentiae bacterium]|nr:branched-chain amino acid transport system II carrier protein [Candidatus Dependentiae bacterium]